MGDSVNGSKTENAKRKLHERKIKLQTDLMQENQGEASSKQTQVMLPEIKIERLKNSKRQCGPVVRALALKSRDPGFKTCSDHSLNLFLVVPGSTS